MDKQKLKGFLIVKLAYIIAFVAAAFTLIYGLAFSWPPDALLPGLIKWLFIADVVGTVVIFIFSYAFRNSSMYDPYWSVIPIWIVLFLLWFGSSLEGNALAVRELLVVGFTVVWGARLTWNWFRGWTGMQHEDWRYVDLAEKHGRAYWLVSFSGIHMMPTLLVFLACLPMIPALSPTVLPDEWLSRPAGLLDIVAALLCFVGIYFEWVGDNQKRKYLLSNPPKGEFLKEGLWAISRHPNYFGEITFWWGIALFGFASLQTVNALTLALCFGGALAITLLFVFISIPMMDKRMAARRTNYAAFMKEVPALFPRFYK